LISFIKRKPITRESDDETETVWKTWESQENGHFSLNNGANSSWIRHSAISYEKKNISLICIQIPENVAFYFSSKDQ
jgi:hypothetical protein